VKDNKQMEGPSRIEDLDASRPLISRRRVIAVKAALDVSR
jgi:hypothetical protein